jgi:hypothetical protein
VVVGATVVFGATVVAGASCSPLAAGFDMPDPAASGQFPEFNKDNAEFDAAYEQCADGIAGGKRPK